MPPTNRTVRRACAWMLLMLAALAACVPASTIATAAPDLPMLVLARPEGDSEDDTDEDDDTDEETETDSDEDQDEDSDDDGDDSDTDEVDEDKLPDNVKAILQKNREAARKAEREARKLRRQNERLRKPPKPKKDDEDETSTEPDLGTLKLRQVNLRDALEAEGYPTLRARAVADLIASRVEFDDEDEPVDVEDAIDAAIKRYGEEMAGKGETPKPKPKPRKKVSTNGGEGGGGTKPPKLTADELAMAKSFGMSPEEYAKYKTPTAGT